MNRCQERLGLIPSVEGRGVRWGGGWMWAGAISVGLVLATSACTDKAPVEILDPPRGAMLPAAQPVELRVKADKSGVTVNGQALGGTGTRSITLDAADGLGFAVAAAPGDPLLAVRSWHQGAYRAPGEFHPATLALRLGDAPVSHGPASVAGLVATLLANEELESYVQDPLSFTVTIVIPVTVTVMVDSVVSPNVDVTMGFVGGDLQFTAVLHDVDVDYTATAASFSSTGTARFDTITVQGTVAVTTSDVTLENLQTSASDPVITDSGSLPAQAVQPLASQLKGDVPGAVASAAQSVADSVFSQLITSLRPQVGLAFEHPVTQETQVEDLVQGGTSLALSYGTRIVAESPSVARADQQVLAREDTASTGDGTGLTVRVGRALVNQYAFALWDAGNFSGLAYTQAELEALGMESLEFPYSNLNTATISLLLPPLLEFGADGPRLDIGGIEIALDVTDAPATTAWTAASVPVELVQDGDALRILPDASRAVTIRDVGFDKMSSLVSAEKVLRLLGTAVPGVVSSVFGSLPTVEMQPMTLDRLDGSAGPTVAPHVLGVHVEADAWLLDLELGLGQ